MDGGFRAASWTEMLSLLMVLLGYPAGYTAPMMLRAKVGMAILLAAYSSAAWAEPPAAMYAFPAGGQRGTKVALHVGGMFLYDKAPFEMLGPGVSAATEIKRTETTWFEGPLIRQPASQAAENYPKDYTGEVQLAADAPVGFRRWRVWNAQGVTPLVRFVVGDLPEVVEDEIDGQPIPVAVTPPVTINGRVFPREDVDAWSFDAQAGQAITCSLAAEEFGSPLKGRLEIRGAGGKPLAETTGTAGEVRLRFVAAETGRYEVRIHDIQFGGLQNYVYRLTMTNGPWLDAVYPLGGQRGTEIKLETLGQSMSGTLAVKVPDSSPTILYHSFDHAGRPLNPVRFDVDELPELLEVEPNNSSAQARPAPLPAVVNGRIDRAGDKDAWQLALTKGQTLRIQCRAALLGSPLAAELVLRDEAGQELARADALDASGDPVLNFTAPTDGKYLLEIGDKFSSRGGAAFSYRIRIAPPQKTPDFELIIPDALALDADGAKNLEVQVLRNGDFKGLITLHLEGLPVGITTEDVKLPDGAPKGVLVVKSAPNPPVMTALLKVIGTAEVDGKPVQRTAHVASIPGDVPVEQLRLVTTLKTPFKFRGTYDLRFAARGTVLRKKYLLERGGFEGPLEVRLADKQGRHLQGVSGPVMTIPPGASEFEYPLTLAPWMELSRTSRTNLMLTGEVKDSAGAVHKVSFSTQEQNEQLVALVAPGPLKVVSQRKSFTAVPGGELVVDIELKRDRSISSPIKLELVVPKHVRDVSAEAVTLTAGTDSGQLRVRFGAAPGPFNLPLVLRATAERGGEPIIGETEIELTP